ncbi:hypothetical protein BJV74DRAFT_879097 [Russula compacta]|nr:hypothetical protein BJV74DRAFT_879097 [Russula compacta]
MRYELRISPVPGSNAWRYWEDADNETALPKIDGEPDNRPGKGRFERMTNDGYSYHSVAVSSSNRGQGGFHPFFLPSRLIAPKMGKECISVDDMRLALTMYHGHSYRPLYIVDISGIGLRDARARAGYSPQRDGKVDGTSYRSATFSRDAAQAHMLYLITSAFGDFASVVAYDTLARTGVVHITTPELPDLRRPLRPIPWETTGLLVTPTALFFCANVEGWQTMYAMWLSSGGGGGGGGTNACACEVIEVRMLDWARPSGNLFLSIAPRAFRQAPPKLLKFKSFDELESKTAVPVVINIYGGPEEPEADSVGNLTSFIYGYLLNELGCGVLYPNVRGSTRYGKRTVSWMIFPLTICTIGAFLVYIYENMKNKLISSRIAVMGDHAHGGYMVYVRPTFSLPLSTRQPSFLENTADRRRDERRDPRVRAFLERISPLSNTEKILVPISIAHGEENSRVPVGEALRLWDIASKRVYMELIQKSVIEFTNAVNIHFLERFLLPNANPSCNI